MNKELEALIIENVNLHLEKVRTEWILRQWFVRNPGGVYCVEREIRRLRADHPIKAVMTEEDRERQDYIDMMDQILQQYRPR